MMFSWAGVDVEEELHRIKAEDERRFRAEQSKLRQPRPAGCKCTLRFTCAVCLSNPTRSNA